MANIFLREWPWWVVYGAAILASYYFARKMRKKGIDPCPTFKKAEKYEEKIDRFTDLIAVGMIILIIITAIKTIYPFLREYRNPTEPLNEETGKLMAGAICILFTSFLGFAVFLAGITTFFQRNLTIKKRVILLVISILPLPFVTAWFFTGDGMPVSTKLWTIIGYAIPIGIINGPGIVSGRSFFELSARIWAKLSHKMQQS